jgi:GntR family transcriptional regulator, transcriptional repressor for pyruvate dehydrogenase complex
MFEDVSRDKMPMRIIRQMRSAILSGKLKPGDHLPPEKELLEQFGVSKHTLREALRALEIIGLVNIRKGAGGGPIIGEVDLATTRDLVTNFLHFKNVSVPDLSQVRKLIEPNLARMAAERLTAQEIESLKAMNQACRKALNRGENIIGAKFEIEFHTLLAEASGNALLILILDFTNSYLGDMKMKIQPGLNFGERVLEAHEEILKAIEERNGDAASKAMLAHVCDVEEQLENIRSISDAHIN